MLRSLTLGKIWNNKTKIKQTKNIKDHFPSGPGVKSPPCNARDASSIPGGGTKTPHSIPQSSTTAEACTPQLVCVLQQKDPTWCKEGPACATKTLGSKVNKSSYIHRMYLCVCVCIYIYIAIVNFRKLKILLKNWTFIYLDSTLSYSRTTVKI